MQAEVGFDETGGDDAVVLAIGPSIPVARWVMAASLMALNLLDVITTKLILRAGGTEANPVMRSIVDHPYAAYALKLTMALVVGCLLLRAPRSSRLADRAVLVAIGAYILVIGWNVALVVTAAKAGRVF